MGILRTVTPLGFEQGDYSNFLVGGMPGRQFIAYFLQLGLFSARRKCLVLGLGERCIGLGLIRTKEHKKGPQSALDNWWVVGGENRVNDK